MFTNIEFYLIYFIDISKGFKKFKLKLELFNKETLFAWIG